MAPTLVLGAKVCWGFVCDTGIKYAIFAKVFHHMVRDVPGEEGVCHSIWWQFLNITWFLQFRNLCHIGGYLMWIFAQSPFSGSQLWQDSLFRCLEFRHTVDAHEGGCISFDTIHLNSYCFPFQTFLSLLILSGSDASVVAAPWQYIHQQKFLYLLSRD